MAATDAFVDTIGAVGPATKAEAVTPSDTVDLTRVSRALWVGVAGDVKVTMRDGGANVVFSNMTVGWHPIRASRILSTGTTASSIVSVS